MCPSPKPTALNLKHVQQTCKSSYSDYNCIMPEYFHLLLCVIIAIMVNSFIIIAVAVIVKLSILLFLRFPCVASPKRLRLTCWPVGPVSQDFLKLRGLMANGWFRMCLAEGLLGFAVTTASLLTVLANGERFATCFSRCAQLFQRTSARCQSSSLLHCQLRQEQHSASRSSTITLMLLVATTEEAVIMVATVVRKQAEQ